MAQARRELRGVVQAAEAMQDVGKTLSTYVSAPLAALGVLSVKVAGDFQAAFNRVEAATQASGAELDALRDKTKNIALDPTLKFSATQAAAALENLAKNGLTTQQILNGAADATVNLATATGGQLATSADIATDVMNNFNLTATELAASVNTITGTTIASKLDIDNYRMALGQAGGVAGQLGVKFGDFNTALAVTSSGFSSGSDAGTSFKTFLQRLVPQSKEAEQAMRQLGLKFFDAQGQMKPLRDIAGELQRAFKGLSDEQRNSLGTKIFGADSIRTALLLAKDGAEGFDKMAESIGKVNAATQGKTLSQGFNGALEGLKSAFEGLQIAIAESGLLDFTTKIVRGLGEFTSSLAQLDPAVLRIITTLAGIAIAVGPVLVAIGSLGLALLPITAGFAVLAGPIGIAVAAFAALAAGVALLVVNSTTATEGFRAQAASVNALSETVNPLLKRYDELKAKTILTKTEQEELRSIIEKVGKQIPTSITAFDSYGRAMDINSGKARDFVKSQQEILAIKNRDELTKQREEYTRLTTEINLATQALNKRNAAGQPVRTDVGLGQAGAFDIELTGKEIVKLQQRLEALRGARRGVGGLIDELKGIKPVIVETNQAGGIVPPVTPQVSATTKTEVDKVLRALQKLNEGYDSIAARRIIKPQETPEFALKMPAPQGLPTTLQPLPGFDTSALAASTEAARLAYERMSDAQKLAFQNTLDFNTKMGEAIDQLSVSVGPLLANFAGQFADAFGSIIAGTASAGDAMTQLFAGITGALGSFMGTFGQQLIVIGIGKLGLDNLFAAGPAGGPAAIAAGIGLVALAGIAKAVSSSASSSLGGITGGGGGSGANTPTNYSAGANAGQNTAPLKIQVEVTGQLRGAGKDLVALITANDYRRLRTS